MAATYDFLIEQGAHFRKAIRWRRGATPTDITGFAVRMHMRETVKSPVVSFEFSTGNGRVAIGVEGVFVLSATASETAKIRPASYLYDIEMTSPGGVVFRLIEGVATVTAEITRR